MENSDEHINEYHVAFRKIFKNQLAHSHSHSQCNCYYLLNRCICLSAAHVSFHKCIRILHHEALGSN